MDIRVHELANLQALRGKACDMKACHSTAAKQKALLSHDAELSGLVDNLIDLWSKMVNADHEHDIKIASNVERLQLRADETAKSLAEKLAKLRLASAEANNKHLPGHEPSLAFDTDQGPAMPLPSPTTLFDSDQNLVSKDAEIHALQKQLAIAQKKQEDYEALLGDIEMSKDEALIRASRAQVTRRVHKVHMPRECVSYIIEHSCAAALWQRTRQTMTIECLCADSPDSSPTRT